MLIIITINLTHNSASSNTPAGKMTILAIKAANIEYAVQLNHLKSLEVVFIFSELTTPKNLDKYVANEVTKITKIMLLGTSLILTHPQNKQ